MERNAQTAPYYSCAWGTSKAAPRLSCPVLRHAIPPEGREGRDLPTDWYQPPTTPNFGYFSSNLPRLSTINAPSMQNKPNFQKAETNAKSYATESYKDMPSQSTRKNKPNSNPIPPPPQITAATADYRRHLFSLSALVLITRNQYNGIVSAYGRKK